MLNTLKMPTPMRNSAPPHRTATLRRLFSGMLLGLFIAHVHADVLPKAPPSPSTLKAPSKLNLPFEEDGPTPPNMPTETSPRPTAPTPAQTYDYSANLKSDTFGAKLFTGSFAKQGATQFNPDYMVALGDNIQVRMWGAYDYAATLVVDPKGNIFLPHLGPVKLLGVRNQNIQATVEAAVAKVFRANVFSYASLATAQPVRVFVGGFVNRPGLYGGTSMDSLLHYLDQAGGIDLERGSFLSVQVKRGSQIRLSVNLYDFLLEGRMPLAQLADGDVIFVSPRQNTIKVSGMAENANRFEFGALQRAVDDILKIAKPFAQATHLRITRNSGAIKNVEYYPIERANSLSVQNGDEIELTADKKIGTITVRVEGEHQSAQEYVLPHGATLSDLIKQVKFSDQSDLTSLQLFRISVKERQSQLLQTSLKSLETVALTAKSGSSDEARLRKDEAENILQWIDRAKKIVPSGQVLIAQAAARDALPLEAGDIIRVPTKDGLVLISGEVLFPNAIAFDPKLDVNGYIRRAGGYTQNADAARIVVAHRDGSFDDGISESGFLGFGSKNTAIREGDEILVLPKIDVKSRQIAKDLTQILYQIAVSARVVLGL